MADTHFSHTVLHHLSCLHPHLATCATREGQGFHARCKCGGGYSHRAYFPLFGPSGEQTWVMGCPLHAMDPVCVDFLEHILAWFVGRTVVCPVWVLLRFDRACVFVLWCSCQLWRWSEWVFWCERRWTSLERTNWSVNKWTLFSLFPKN